MTIFFTIASTDAAELVEQGAMSVACVQTAAKPSRMESTERAHDRHDLGDVELEQRLGHFAQSFRVRDDGQVAG